MLKKPVDGNPHEYLLATGFGRNSTRPLLTAPASARTASMGDEVTCRAYGTYDVGRAAVYIDKTRVSFATVVGDLRQHLDTIMLTEQDLWDLLYAMEELRGPGWGPEEELIAALNESEPLLA